MSHTTDFSTLEANVQAYEGEIKAACRDIVRKSAVSYADGAARYVPPMVNGQWSRSIPAKLYKRKIYDLPSIIKVDTRNRKLFSAKLKEGYRFVVKGKLKGESHFWFATTLRKAATYTRIYNRGMFKFLFGGNLGSIGEEVPTFFQKLLKKSPNLAKHLDKNRFTLKSEQDSEGIKIGNDAWDNEAFARESIYRGEAKAKKTMKKMWKDFEKESKEV